tara:strand:- start:272 stop:1429 length:1158 start_codon:yes stop_codon:yes gene_type:complete
MKLELPEELRLMRGTLRRFIDNEVIPYERESWNGSDLKPEFREKWEARAKELGIWQIDLPEEFGGMGLGLLARVVVWEEIGRTIAFPRRKPWVFGHDLSPILVDYLNEEQREKYLYPVIRGEKKHAFAQTEPDAGGDAGAIRTSAVRDGDHFVINGMKRFITSGDDADFFKVTCVTASEKNTRRVSCILVDANTPGVSVLRRQETMMDDQPCEIAFDDARVPIANLIGNEGDGFKMAQHWITIGRIRHGAGALGVMERCLEMSVNYAQQRKTFGCPLADRQAIQWPIVDIYADLQTMRPLIYNAAAKFDAGSDIRWDSYLCKYLGDRKGYEAADRCLQIFGGMGLTTDLPVEKFWRDMRSMMITEGPEEILRMSLAQEVLRQYGN